MDNGLREFERTIALDQGAKKCYEGLRANGLKNTVLFKELIDSAVATIADKQHFSRCESLKKNAYFPTRLKSVADEIEALNGNPLFVPDLIEHNELPRKLRDYADRFQRRRERIKQARKGQRQPTGQLLSSLLWWVEVQTNRKPSPAALAKILDAVLASATANAKNPPTYDFEANLKKILSQSPKK